jgi:hypothetical protein
MNPSHPARGLDSLRLFALGRIPRCGRCDRYRVFLASVARLGGAAEPLPEVPASCTYQVCAPLAARYTEDHRRQRRSAKVLHAAGSAFGGPTRRDA